MHSLFQRTKPFKKKGNKFNFYYIQCQGIDSEYKTLFSIPAEFCNKKISKTAFQRYGFFIKSQVLILF